MQGRGAWEAESGTIDTPGPEYLPTSSGDSRHVEAPSYSMGGKLEAKPLSDGPGPGIQGESHLPSAPSFTIAGRDAWEPPPACPLDETPGPTYLPATSSSSKLPSAPAYTMAAKLGDGDATSPTPAAGDVSDSHRLSAPSYSMLGRRPAPRPSETPAPTYAPAPLPTGIAYSMGVKLSTEAPAPTTGPVPHGSSHLPNAPAYTFKGRARPPPPVGTPGPSEYGPTMPTHLPTAPAFTMRAKTADGLGASQTPAAEAYQRPDFRSAPTFSLGGRLPDPPTKPTPGPAYLPPSQSTGGITMGARHVTIGLPDALPGPGAYASEDALGKGAPKFSMGGRGRAREPIPDPTTDYDHQQPYLKAHHRTAPAVSLAGKAPLDSRTTAPGPGSYATSKLTHRGQTLLGRSCACGGPCRLGLCHSTRHVHGHAHGRVHGHGGGQRERQAHQGASLEEAEQPFVRGLYRKLPPRGTKAESYTAHVARAASLLSAEQLEKLGP